MATPWVAVIVTQLQLELIDGYTVIEQHTVPWLPLLSVIVTVYVNVPVEVGVPEIVPVFEILRPGGSPVALNVYGPPAPPLALSVTGVIAIPFTALTVTHVDVIGAGFTVIEQFNVSVSPALSVIVIT